MVSEDRAMVSLEDLRRLGAANGSAVHRPEVREQVLEDLGHPDDETLARSAYPYIDSPDRNVRVAMLRVLGMIDCQERTEAVLRGLDDLKPRVARVAFSIARKLLHEPRVVRRLREIVEVDDSKMRGAAFAALGPDGPLASAVLADFVKIDKYRGAVLRNLLSAPLRPDTRSLLEQVVRTGTKEEAVAATRRLCGYRLVNLGKPPADLRKRVERVEGTRVIYWIRDEDFDALVGRDPAE